MPDDACVSFAPAVVRGGGAGLAVGGGCVAGALTGAAGGAANFSSSDGALPFEAAGGFA
jgi:hypothetical protein